MRNVFALLILCLLLCSATSSKAQDFSNKGKEFWIAYSYHVGMASGDNPSMTLYLSSDVSTNYRVEAANGTPINTGVIAPNQVVTVNIPSTYMLDGNGTFSNKAIHVTGDKAFVVYSFITRRQASAATLCLPTTVLGKEYITSSFTQNSNEPNSNSFISVIAIEDNTTVEIIPTANNRSNWAPGSSNLVTLQKGQVFQLLGTTSGNSGTDLSGTVVRSVSNITGESCKKIAVFSGSGKVMIQSPTCTGGGGDNLYQQLYPTASWGKKYLTAPSVNKPNNFYRIYRTNATSNIYLNGLRIGDASFTNNYYQFANNIPNKIESDQPISVVQYFTSYCLAGGNPNPYDPDMIILNPVEQNINSVTLINSPLTVNGTHQHNIHLVMKKGGTAQTSFQLDGNPVPVSNWVTHPQDNDYAYLYLSNIGSGTHRLYSDSGFNAIAYGYGDAETYGYSAGTNVKDIYQFISVKNLGGEVSLPASCVGSAAELSMTFPYQPTYIKWVFNGHFPDVELTSPTHSSTTIVSGRTLYTYKLPGTYTFPNEGTYPIKILAENLTGDGCQGLQEIDFDFEVFAKPIAQIQQILTDGCATSAVNFIGGGDGQGRPFNKWYWNFGDNLTANTLNATHSYGASGDFNVGYVVTTDIGCVSDTAFQTVSLMDPPIAEFSFTGNPCVNNEITFTDASTSSVGSEIQEWIWNFGDGSAEQIKANKDPFRYAFATAGTYKIRLKVRTASGCESVVFEREISVFENPNVNFSLPIICLPIGVGTFTDLSTASGSSIQSWVWDFGDGSPTVSQASPTHQFNATGPYDIKLTVTTPQGCTNSVAQTLRTIFAEPIADFEVASEVCVGLPIYLEDKSQAPGSSIQEWIWKIDGQTVIKTTNDRFEHVFTSPGVYEIELAVKSINDCNTINNIAKKTVAVNALPMADFAISADQCVNSIIEFSDLSTSANGAITQWNWNFGNGIAQTVLTNTPVNLQYSTPGTFSPSLQVTSEKGCVSSVVSKPLEIFRRPQTAFVVPADICVNDINAQFLNNSSIVTGGIAQWNWTFNDPHSTLSNPNTSTDENPTHHFTQAGSYDVQLVTVSDKGCTDTLVQPVFVNSDQIVVDFKIDGATTFCSGQEIVITDASSIDKGRFTKLEIYWDYSEDPTIKTEVLHPSSSVSYRHVYAPFYSPNSRTVTINYVLYSGENCVEEIQQEITLFAQPQIVFNAIPAICELDEALQITQVQHLNAVIGTGVYSGSGITATGLFSPSMAGVGNHLLTYTFTGDNGCMAEVQSTISVNPNPIIVSGGDKYVLQGGQVELTPQLMNPINVSYTWTPPNDLTDANIARPFASPQEDITYQLLVVSEAGCTAQTEVLVKVLPMIQVPNIFSPNGDGIHDTWVIPHLSTYPGCTINIFNRYGQLVWHNQGGAAWDGKSVGKDVPVGTYYYVIDPKNGREKITGYVDVIR